MSNSIIQPISYWKILSAKFNFLRNNLLKLVYYNKYNPLTFQCNASITIHPSTYLAKDPIRDFSELDSSILS